ncbi:MAG TPA: amidohydrolase family protein [Myxococcaceae bacterium]|nr:amidohydrolase family protein [Myxococcaceae bacterium]
MHRVVWLFAALLCRLALAGTVDRYSLLTSTGRIGTLVVRSERNVVDVDWRVDQNGRGPKVHEHLVLDASGLPTSREISGTNTYGAPVKESFQVEAGRARWKTLDDSGEAPSSNAIYVDNRGSPWSQMHQLRVLLASKGLTRAALPSGTLRLEKVRSVKVGRRVERLDAYALWGLGLSPQVLLARGSRLVASLDPFAVLVEDGFPESFERLSALASDLSAELLVRLSRRLAHRVDGPVWITQVNIFDPATGTSSAGRNVVLYGDRIVGLRSDAPPAGAVTIDGGGGTLLPGLLDAHAHMDDWSALLHVASGVTFVRDPGNDNQRLLDLVRRIDSGELIGPRVKMSGFLEGKSPFSAAHGFTVRTLDEALDKVRWYADHGFWGIKIYNSMPPDLVKPIAAEAHRLGLHVSGHVPAFMTAERAIADGYDEISHINQLLLMFVLRDTEDPRTPFRFTVIGERLKDVNPAGAGFQRLLGLMKQRHTALDPTLATFVNNLAARPGTGSPVDAPWLDHVPTPVRRDRKSILLDIKPAQYAAYEASQKRQDEFVALLHREGIPLVPGTDDLPGLGLHSELESWVHAGISPADTLVAATLGGARFLGSDAELGSISVGKRADLYLVEGDPLKDIHEIRKGRLVVKNGVLYFPDEMESALGIVPFARHVEPTSAAPPKPAAR